MSKITASFFCLGFVALPLSALAEPACTDAKDLVGLVQSFYGADPSLTDVIDPQVMMRMSALEGFPEPDGIRYVYKEVSRDLLLDEGGIVQGLETALDFNKDGKLCKLVNGDFVEDTDEDTASVNMNFTFRFRDSSGEHSYENLQEGLKDGSKIMSSLAPGGLGFVVPKLKAFAVTSVGNDSAKPIISFFSKGELVSDIEISEIGKMQMFKRKALKKAKVDQVNIEGAYKLMGQFNYDEDDIERMKAQSAEADTSDEAKTK